MFETNPADEIAYIEQKSAGFFSFLAFLDSRYRAIKNRWLLLRLPSYEASLLEQANDLKQVVEYLDEKLKLAAQESVGNTLFGGLWQGENSNWMALENYIVWVLEFRRLCVQHGLREQALITASHAAPDLTVVQKLEKKTREIQSLLDKFVQVVGLPSNYSDGRSLEFLQARVRADG